MKSARELLKVDDAGIVTAPYILVHASGKRMHIRPLGDAYSDVLCEVAKGIYGETSIFNINICAKCLRELAKRPEAPEPHRAIVGKDKKDLLKDDPTENDTTEEAEEPEPVRLYELDLAYGRFEVVRAAYCTIVYDEDGDEFLRVPGDFPREAAEFFIPVIQRSYNTGVETGKRMRSAEIRKLLGAN